MVRNFWVEASIDGRQTNLTGGPRTTHGGMAIDLYQREDGCISRPITIYCREWDGKLITEIYVNGEKVSEVVTNR